MKQNIKKNQSDEPKLEFSIYDYTIFVYENRIVVMLTVDGSEKEVIRYNC